MAASMSVKTTLILCSLMCGFSAVLAGSIQVCSISKPPQNCTQNDLIVVWNCTRDRCISAMQNGCAGKKCQVLQIAVTQFLNQVSVAVYALIAKFTNQALIVLGVTILINICILFVNIVEIILVGLGCVVLTVVTAVTIIVQICTWLAGVITLLALLSLDAALFISVFVIFKLIFCIMIDLIIGCAFGKSILFLSTCKYIGEEKQRQDA